MAEVTVRIKLDQEFTVSCDGTDADSVLENIVSEDHLGDRLKDAAYDTMTVVSAQYDEVEEDEDDEEDDEDAEGVETTDADDEEIQALSRELDKARKYLFD